MARRFSAEFLRERLEAGDTVALYNVVTSCAAYDRSSEHDGLPPPLFLFARICEWDGAARSGVWQFYEALDPHKAAEILDAMAGPEWSEVRERFEFGLRHWEAADRSGAVDDWLDANYERLRSVLVAMLSREIAALDAVA